MDFRPVIEVNSSEAISDKKALKSLKSFLKQHKTEDGFGIDRIPPPVISNIETMISFMSSQTLTKESHINEDRMDEIQNDEIISNPKPTMKRKIESTILADSAEEQLENSNANSVGNSSKKSKKKKAL